MVSFRANDAHYDITVPEVPAKLQQSRYLPLAQDLEIKIYENQKDPKIGYFKLPLGKLYEHPHKNHLVKVNCVWQEDSKVVEGNSAVVKLGIIYMKDVTARYNILIKNADLKRDTEAFGKMDPYVICKVGDVTSKTAVKDDAGKTPVWN